MADVFKALSDPTRREILRLLQAGDMTAGAIAENFAISKPSISHHLSALNTTVFQDIIGFAMQFLGERTDGETGGRR